tara:strand:+ start:447 stop:647 length:201 start_codon:yes stop_codon:yes gene_type:complete
MKKMKGYKAGGALKTVPSGDKYKGLRMLSTDVRNKMGYMKIGGVPEYGHGGPVKFIRKSKRGGRCI